MEENTKKQLEEKLQDKVNKIVFDITEGMTYQARYATLEVSSLQVCKIKVRSYISTYYNTDKFSIDVFVCPENGDYWVLNDIKSFRKDFLEIEECEKYIDSEEFAHEFQNSDIWKYLTDEDFRQIKIRERNLSEIQTFERYFMELIRNVGGKEIMRILSPLNSIVAYGGDFEAVRDMVNKIANIMSENANLKNQLKSISPLTEKGGNNK